MFHQIRRRLVTEASRKKKPFAKTYQSPEQLLEDTKVQAILQESGLLSDRPFKDKNTKIKILAHLSAMYNEPVPSNVLKQMNSAADVVKWYSNQLKPIGALPHARNLIHATLKQTPDLKGNLEDRIDLEREAVQGELLSKLPKNIQLDEKIFRQANPVGLQEKRKRFRSRKGGLESEQQHQ